jgi:hypothetical protein
VQDGVRLQEAVEGAELKPIRRSFTKKRTETGSSKFYKELQIDSTKFYKKKQERAFAL